VSVPLPSDAADGTAPVGSADGTAPVGSADGGLFGPGSISWLVHADPLMGLAGLRALLLQALHPVALAGVTQNSSFREDPWGRLVRTAEYVGAVTYGSTVEAQRAGARVRGVHRRVRGVDEQTGRAFRATDPDLLLWVHCCEVESFLSTVVRGGLRLTPGEIDGYYAEQVRAAELIGIPADTVPDSAAAMEAYFTRKRPELTAGPQARRVARFILAPPMPPKIRYLTPARPAWFSVGVLGFSLLPRWARRLYRLPGLPTTDLSAGVVSRGLRFAALSVPGSLRDGPHVKAARERMGLAPGQL
jgi:uncharacterized protein (DUF2236 family)